MLSDEARFYYRDATTLFEQGRIGCAAVQFERLAAALYECCAAEGITIKLLPLSFEQRPDRAEAHEDAEP